MILQPGVPFPDTIAELDDTSDEPVGLRIEYADGVTIPIEVVRTGGTCTGCRMGPGCRAVMWEPPAPVQIRTGRSGVLHGTIPAGHHVAIAWDKGDGTPA